MSQPPSSVPSDPLKAWRDWFVQNEREWSESLTRIMKTDEVARAVGQQINAALHGQQMLTQGLAAPLGMMNLPTREDVAALGERLGRLEDAVARMEAALVEARDALAPSAVRHPPRTRKAPAPRPGAAAGPPPARQQAALPATAPRQGTAKPPRARKAAAQGGGR